MEYRYDVFLSYSRQPLIENWVRNFFFDQLQFWLNQEFPTRDARIFWDQTGIEPGDYWAEALKEAIRGSACLVSIWAPSYFKSKWCVAEFVSFLKRLGDIPGKRPRLIIPIRWHDGDSFPPAAKRIEYRPFDMYTSLVRETAPFVDFEFAVKELAKSIKKAVDDAPPFRSDWPITEPADIEALVKLDPAAAADYYNFDRIFIPNPRKARPL
jgi:hypothetical protein